MSHTMVIRQKPNVQSTDELWLQQINYLEGLKWQDASEPDFGTPLNP